MNELLLALRSTYMSTPRTSSSSPPATPLQSTTTSSVYQDVEEVEQDGPFLEPITPLLRKQSSVSSFLSSPSPTASALDELFTPRTRKKWSQCTNNLFISTTHHSSGEEEVDGGGCDVKETSIDGIFIEFDNNTPRVVDRKRCSHVSALARVTCVHGHKLQPPPGGPPERPRRKPRAKKARSCERGTAEKKKSTGKRARPYSAGKVRVPETLDPISIYLDASRTGPSRESLSSSEEERVTPQISRTEVASEEDAVSVHSHRTGEFETGAAGESDKENKEGDPESLPDNHGNHGNQNSRGRRLSEEHFLEEGRYHQRDEVQDIDHHLPTVPEDFYKAVQQRTPNEHIFAQYGKEVRRVVVPALPVPLEKLLEKCLTAYSDLLTAEMVPLKAIYIQDPQTKIFYQLDDANDVKKGAHLKIHEEFVSTAIDRGSSQSLEDLQNTSNSSLSSSGGFVIQPLPQPIKRPGKSRLSLVEEKLSMITNEMHHIRSDAGSTVSSQTDFGPEVPTAHLHTLIRSLHGQLQQAKVELIALKRREVERRGEMEAVVRETREEIVRHITASLPQGIRRMRMEVDKVEGEYRNRSEATYTNIKDLERAVDVLRSDVVKRKVRLDPIQLDTMEAELRTYTDEIATMNTMFSGLKEKLKIVMKEELEIIVNEEQFLGDEEPMLEDVTARCQDLNAVMESLKKVAEHQRTKGTSPLYVFTASEFDILEERGNVIAEIAALVPNHEERILSIQETEEIRAAQRKFTRSDSDMVTEEINFKAQNLRKTNAFEELDRKRDAALREMYNAKPPPHKFGRKTSEVQFPYESRALSPERKVSKCKSMSSIAAGAESSPTFQFEEPTSDQGPVDEDPPDPAQSGTMKRSKSFNKEKGNSSEEEKAKKKPTMFSALFKKKKSEDKGTREGEDDDELGPLSPRPTRAQTLDNTMGRNGTKSKGKATRVMSLDDKGKSGKKGKNR